MSSVKNPCKIILGRLKGAGEQAETTSTANVVRSSVFEVSSSVPAEQRQPLAFLIHQGYNVTERFRAAVKAKT